MKYIIVLLTLCIGLANAFGVKVICNDRHPKGCYYKEKFYVGYYPRYRPHRDVIIIDKHRHNRRDDRDNVIIIDQHHHHHNGIHVFRYVNRQTKKFNQQFDKQQREFEQKVDKLNKNPQNLPHY